MREGKNREVKNVLGHLGLAVNRLIRVSYGPFQVSGLAEGADRGGQDPGAARATRRENRRAVGCGFFRAGPRGGAAAARVTPIVRPRRAHRAQPRMRRGTRRVDASSRRRGAPSRPAAARATAPKSPRHALPSPSATARAGARPSASASRNWRVARRSTAASGLPAPRPEAGAKTGSRQAGSRRQDRAPQEALMRIVGGRLRSRALVAPKSQAIRPTTDRLREIAVQHPAACLRRSGRRRPRARPVRRHRRARIRGAVARRRLRAVRRRRRRGARHCCGRTSPRWASAARRASFGATRQSSAPAHPIEPFSLVFVDPPYGRGPRRAGARVGAATAAGSRPARSSWSRRRRNRGLSRRRISSNSSAEPTTRRS